MSLPDRDKGRLYPAFADMLTDFENRLAAANLPFFLFEGMRTWERQAELYAQGRTKPGQIVTWAKPGQSFHFAGLAADFVLDGTVDKPGAQWSWDMAGSNYQLWERMARIAQECGFEAGFFWQRQDPPHIQCRFGMSIFEARELFEQGGLDLIWERATAFLENATWP